MASLKAEDVAGIRMRRTGLAGSPFDTPLDVVRGHLAMQAQDYGPAKWSVGQRLAASQDGDIERKVSEGTILRTHVLRSTWHFVARRDLRWLMELSGPRVQKGIEPRYRRLDLDAKTRSRAEKIVARALDGEYLTRPELAEVLRKSRVDIDGQRLPHLLMHCELESVVCSGPPRGKDQTYALFDERVPKGRPPDRERAVIDLVRRYLTSHGPATLKDMSWWSGLTISDLKGGLDGLGHYAHTEEVGGLTLWWVGDVEVERSSRSVVQLLQAYDEWVVGYTESRYLGDPRAERLRHAFADRTIPTGTVVLGSRVVGHWRRSIKEKTVEVEVKLYRTLDKRGKTALDDTVSEFARFLGKEPRLDVGML